MLTELHVKNFAIIDELNASFGEGLTIISGETGAGKSIIIGAISLLLGDRATVDMIRSSEDSAEIEAMFDINQNDALKQKLRENDLYDGPDLVIKRIITRSGRNRIYINDHISTLGVLSSISESLVNICSQHEHQVIMNVENHIDILDGFGELSNLREMYAEEYDTYQALRAKLEELKSTDKKRIEREDFIKYQLQELKDADLKIGEDTTLEEEKSVLSNVQKLRDYSQLAYEILYSKSDSLLSEFKQVIQTIKEINKIDLSLKVNAADMDSLYYQIEDAAFAVRDYAKSLSFDPGRMDNIEDRLEIIKKLKRKHGDSIADILEARKRLQSEIDAVEKIDVEIEKTNKELAIIESRLMEKAHTLSEKRLSAATKLKKAIEQEIHTLNMAMTRFDVIFKNPDGAEDVLCLGPKGYDTIEFYLSTNVGEDLKPLNRTASGGELSRIMLAAKKVLAATGSVGTIVFDEVDAGIGGATAEIVGKKLKEVATNHQVLCITHLPQIACFGDRHYRVWKDVNCGRTVTSLDILSEEERLDEITRMLGGIEQTKKTREHAKEMILLARR